MKAVLSLSNRSTYAEYLAVEQVSEHRHEFLDGVIVAMAGGSDEHNALASRFGAMFAARLPRGCRTYTPRSALLDRGEHTWPLQRRFDHLRQARAPGA